MTELTNTPTSGATPGSGRLVSAPAEPLSIGGRSYPAETVVRLLEPFVSEDRRARIEEVLAQRTRSVIPVIEGVHDLGNVGAVIRSAEGLGCQELHLIDRGDRFKKSRRTSQGAQKWIDLVKWSATDECIRHLKDRGYRVLATHLASGKPLDRFDFTEPTAIVFGNEADGVSVETLAASDDRCFIPMAGFARSFNVSVAAAIALYHVQRDRTRRLGTHGDLTDDDRLSLRARYYAGSVSAAGQILRRLASSV